MMKKISLSLALILLSASTQAAFDSSTLIKVDKGNNPQCVEYYNFQDGLYCSTKKLQAQKANISPEIRQSESQHIIFDHRPWQAAWGKSTKSITTIEYLPLGDNLEQWKELITSQFIPSAANKITPEEYLNRVKETFKKANLTPKITIHQQTPQHILFEFQMASPSNLEQDELQKITQTPKGLYLLHYVIKKSDMGHEKRNLWIKNLKASTIR